MTLHPFRLALPLAAAACLSGCVARTIPTVAPQAVHLSGKLRGGQQPVSGSTIYLYDSTAALAGLPSQLLTAPVTTDSSGSFTLTGLYTCPAAADQVFIGAQGGDAGAGPNSALVLLTALGNCGDLTAASTVSINEISTVAAIFAYSPYFDPAHDAIIGGGAHEYADFLSLVDPVSGLALDTNGTDIQINLNALSNSIATCVNSADAAGSISFACQDLVTFSAAPGNVSTLPTTIAALYNIASNPTNNVASIFFLSTPTPPFQPTASTTPASWSMNMP